MQFWLPNSSKEAVSAGEFENPGLTCGTSRTPTQRSSQAGAVSSTDISAPLPPRRCPFKSPRAAAALTEGLCHFPSDYHSHFCLYYQQSARAVSPCLEGLQISIYLDTLLPCHEPEQKRGRKSQGGGLGWLSSGEKKRGQGRKEAGVWEGKE